MRNLNASLVLCTSLLIGGLEIAHAQPPEAAAHGQQTAAAQRYMGLFRQAAKEFNVPVEVLQGIAFAETRWRPHVPKGLLHKADPEALAIPEPDGNHHQPPTYGIMGLRNDDHFGHSLTRGAALIGQPVEVVVTKTRQNIRAAAAYLAVLANGKTAETPIEQWEEVIARYSGIPDPEIAQMYSYDVLNSIRLGRESPHYKVGKRDVDMARAYGRERLKELSAPRVTIRLGDGDAG